MEENTNSNDNEMDTTTSTATHQERNAMITHPRICIGNLFNYCLKKHIEIFLCQHNVRSLVHRIRPPNHHNHLNRVFINAIDDDSAQRIISTLHGKTIYGKSNTSSVVDVYLSSKESCLPDDEEGEPACYRGMKRVGIDGGGSDHDDDGDGDNDNVEDQDRPFIKRKRIEDDSDALTPFEKIRNATVPLASKPYPRQLGRKFKCAKQFSARIRRELSSKRYYGSRKDLTLPLISDCPNNLISPVFPCFPSPVQDGYRNKVEFTVGRSTDGIDKTVGFNLGLWTSGNLAVMEPEGLPHVSDGAKRLCALFQRYLRDVSPLNGYDKANKTGHHRQLMVREVSRPNIAYMVVVGIVSQDLNDDQQKEEEIRLIDFARGASSEENLNVTSLCVQWDRRMGGDSAMNGLPVDTLIGTPELTETLLGLRFHINALAFFQINLPSAELMYSLIRDWCSTTKDTTLVDICCGTGTIGLTMAQHVRKVVGVELCEPALADAKRNATFNCITNVEFHCGKAEDILPKLMMELQNEISKKAELSTSETEETIVYDDSTSVPYDWKSKHDVNVLSLPRKPCLLVGVLDPPRGGVGPAVIQAIRKCKLLKRLVYVSCSPNGAFNNIMDLMRPSSKRLQGEPFRCVAMAPVDMFPHTDHYELVVLFERD